MMDFEALLWQAIRRCEGQSGLARTLGYNKNSIRQWLIGIALPDVGVEPRLAQLAGVTPDLLREAIREEAMRRWDRMRNRPPTRRGWRGRPPQLADPMPLPVVGRPSERPKNASDKKGASRPDDHGTPRRPGAWIRGRQPRRGSPCGVRCVRLEGFCRLPPPGRPGGLTRKDDSRAGPRRYSPSPAVPHGLRHDAPATDPRRLLP